MYMYMYMYIINMTCTCRCKVSNTLSIIVGKYYYTIGVSATYIDGSAGLAFIAHNTE